MVKGSEKLTEWKGEIYTQEVFDEIASALKISCRNDKDELRYELEKAAQQFLGYSQMNSDMEADGKEVKAFVAFAKAMKKSRDLFEQLTAYPKVSGIRFYGGLKDCQTDNAHIHEWILKTMHPKAVFDPQIISGIFDTLEKAALQSAKGGMLKIGKINKTETTFFWLCNILMLWKKCFGRKFAQGRYQKGAREYMFGDEEKLSLLMNPINKRLPRGNKISQHHINEAINLVSQRISMRSPEEISALIAMPPSGKVASTENIQAIRIAPKKKSS